MECYSCKLLFIIIFFLRIISVSSSFSLYTNMALTRDCHIMRLIITSIYQLLIGLSTNRFRWKREQTDKRRENRHNSARHGTQATVDSVRHGTHATVDSARHGTHATMYSARHGTHATIDSARHFTQATMLRKFITLGQISYSR